MLTLKKSPQNLDNNMNLSVAESSFRLGGFYRTVWLSNSTNSMYIPQNIINVFYLDSSFGRKQLWKKINTQWPVFYPDKVTYL